MAKRIRTHINPLAVQKEQAIFAGFENLNPIFVDVGAYKGEFMDQLSQQFSDYNYILFELRTPIAEALEKKYGNRSNFAIFDGDASKNFKNILQSSLDKGVKIEKIFVNFPDPWFKEKHKKRRFINAKFLEEISEWLPKDIHFVFQTDQLFLFEETLELIKESPFSQVSFFKDSIYEIPTDWEKAQLKKGSSIWRMEFWQK